MKLQVENFKGWENKTITLPASGLSLISAMSGNGKSSLLEAISFAITGQASGKIKNINSAGNPKVILSFGDITITRSRAPNVLRVSTEDGKFEGMEAQNYIDAVFTGHFSKIGYIRQKGVSAFLEMSGPAKMEFLQDWVLSDNSIGTLKASAKDLTKRKKAELHDLTVKVQVETEFFEGFIKPSTVENPFKGYDGEIEGSEEIYDEWIRSKEKAEKKLKKTKVKSIELAKELKDSKRREKYTFIVGSAKKGLMEVNRQLKEASVGTPETVKDELNRKSLVCSLKNYQDRKRKLEDEGSDERGDEPSAIEETIEKIRESIKIQAELERLKGLVGDETPNENAKEGWENLRDLKEKFEKTDDYSQEEEEKLKKKMVGGMSCPGCGIRVVVTNGELNHSAETEDDKARLKQLSKLGRLLGKLKGETRPSKEDIGNAKRNYDAQRWIKERGTYVEKTEGYLEGATKKDLEDTKGKLSRELKTRADYTNWLEQLEETNICIKRVEKKLEDITVDKTLSSLSEYELQSLLTKYQVLGEVKSEKKRLCSEIETGESILESITTQNSSETVDELINLNNETIFSSMETIKDVDEKKVKVKLYFEYLKQKKTWTSHKKKVGLLTLQKDEAEWNYKQTHKLSEVLSKLEAERIQGFICSLNSSIQSYCDHFFVDEPLTIQLTCFKETKGLKKAQITFNLVYKDYEATDLGILSGGEYDRLQLAVCLAFADISKVPLLMLDESLASLDETTCGTVVAKLSDSKRLTILVAHQVSSEGTFDCVVRL
jgi:DNA repair exonuclease SbcCD ATPase subunit